ncbi:MAG: histidine kinase dimerization/phosphoacceptor domain -containing protein [Spirosomataceae bacterium]
MKNLLVIGGLFANLTAFAIAPADSLQHQYKLAKHDSTRLTITGKWFREVLFANPSLAYRLAVRYDSLAKILQNPSEMARGRNFIGMVYYTQGNYDKCVPFYLDALRRYESLQDSLYVGIVQNNIAAAYQHRGNPKETILYFEKALTIFKAIENKQWIGNVTTNLAAQYLKIKDFKKALEMSYLGLKAFEELNDTYSMGLVYTTIGNVYADQHECTKAIPFFEKTIQRITLDYDPVAVGVAYENMGGCQVKLRQFAEAERNLLTALALFKKHEAPEHAKPTLEALTELYAQQGNYQKAFEMQRQFLVLSDSLFNKEKDAAMLDALKRYESEKQEQQIALLNTQNEVKDLQIHEKQRQQLFLGLGILMLVIVVGVLYKLYRDRQKINAELAHKNEVISTALAEKEVLLREIHHRVKNNLQVVSSLLSLQSRHIDDQKALEALNEGRNRVRSMALIHQNLYQEDNLTGIDVQDYIATLCHSLFNSYNIEPNRIRLETHIEPLRLDVDTVIPLGLILNELITNALKYAFPNQQEGQLSIELHKEEAGLVLQVKDNGVGVPSSFDWKRTASMGFQLVKAFAQKLKAEVEVQGQLGMCVTLRIVNFRMA